MNRFASNANRPSVAHRQSSTARYTMALRWLMDFSRTPGRAAEFTRYIGASGVSFAFDTGIFLMLIQLDAAPAAIAGAMAYACGMFLNYVICVRYIFDPIASGKSTRRLVSEYTISGLFGVALTYCLIALLNGSLGLSPLSAKLITVAVVFLTVYLVRSAKVFAPRSPAGLG